MPRTGEAVDAVRGLAQRAAVIALAGTLLLATAPVGASRAAGHAPPGLVDEIHGFDILLEAGVDTDVHSGPAPRFADTLPSPPGFEPWTPAMEPDPGTAPAAGAALAPTAYRMIRFPIRTLPLGSRPYDDGKVPSLAYHPAYHDAAGVPMRKIDGRLVYKPAGLAQLAIGYLNGYTFRLRPGHHFRPYGRTGNPAYLQRARAIANVFRRIGVRSGGATYLPYDFDFAMHGNPADVIRGPWYSAMAQGLALTLFTRLWETEHDPADLEMARQLYGSLAHVGRGSKPWVTWIDARRNLWLEEYPQPRPDHTLNGFLFAVFGLHEYYVATRDQNALDTLRGALTTLKENVIKYRNAGNPSDYCLKHGKPQLKYHRIVIWQLLLVTAITGDDYFSSVARTFRRDTR